MKSRDNKERERVSAPRPSSAAYEVGYGKPPGHTRFQPGKSGNPGGRPKGRKSARALLEHALSAPITINEAGTAKVIEHRAAMFKSLVMRAIKGDARSAALVIRLMEQLGLDGQPETPQLLVIKRVIVDPKGDDEEDAPIRDHCPRARDT